MGIVMFRFVLATSFVVICYAMKALAEAAPLISSEGALVLLYNVFSVFLFGFFSLACYSAGAFFLPKDTMRSGCDLYLFRSLLGFCYFTLVGYGLALAGWVTFLPALFVLCSPLLVFPLGKLWQPGIDKKYALAVVFLLGLLFYLLCFSGVLFLYVENDFGHYFPMFSDFLASGSNFPGPAFWAAFYLRGHGASFLLAAVSSMYSIQLISLFALGTMAVVVYRLAGIMSSSFLVAIGTALLLFASKALKIESYKGHAVISMLLIAAPYFVVRLYLAPMRTRLRVVIVFAVLLCSIVVISPPAGVFLVLPLVFLLVFAFVRRELGLLGPALLLCVAPAGTFFAVLAINYATTGLAEVTPPALVFWMMDSDKVSKWVSIPSFILLAIESTKSSGFVFAASKLAVQALTMAVFVLLLHIVFRFSEVTKSRHLCLRVFLVLVPVACLGLACPVLSSISEQTSLSRFIVFYSAVQPLYLTGILVCSIPLIVHLVGKLRGISWGYRKVTNVVFVFVSLYALIFNWTPKWQHQVAHTKAFWGMTSLRPVLGHWVSPEVERLDAELPRGDRVMPLYYAHYAYFYNHERFVRPLMNRVVRRLPVLLGTDVQSAIAEYRRIGITRFLVRLDPLESMTHEAFGDLFDSSNVARFFRVRNLGDSIWLLTLTESDLDGVVPDSTFLAAYAKKRHSEIGNPRTLAYRTVEYARTGISQYTRPPWNESGAGQWGQ